MQLGPSCCAFVLVEMYSDGVWCVIGPVALEQDQHRPTLDSSALHVLGRSLAIEEPTL